MNTNSNKNSLCQNVLFQVIRPRYVNKTMDNISSCNRQTIDLIYKDMHICVYERTLGYTEKLSYPLVTVV